MQYGGPISETRKSMLQMMANLLLRNVMDADEFQLRFAALEPAERMFLLELLDHRVQEGGQGARGKCGARY